MKLIDLLLLVAAVLLTIAGVLVAVPLGFAIAGASSGAAWYLLGDG